MLKAGLMEIGNIFAINKADRAGSNKLMITLKNILSTLTIEDSQWLPQVVATVATEGKGIEELMNSIDAHKSFNKTQGIQKVKIDDRYKKRVMKLIADDLMDDFWKDKNHSELHSELEKQPDYRQSPYNLAKQLMMQK